MTVSPQDVKKLRSKTGAGMGDCKKALVEADGNFDEAEKILKKQGLASAAKRSDRQTSEGSVFFAQNAERLIMAEIRCETDFVAMNEEFLKLGDAVARQALSENLSEANEALTTKVQEAVLALKENLNIARIANIAIGANDTIASYSHNNGLIGTAVILHCEGDCSDTQALAELGRNLAMHLAAYQPAFLDSSQVDAKVLAEQEEIFRERAVKENIPEKAREGYLKGQLKKWLAECCFLDQGFVKEPKKTVSKILQDFSKQNGAEVTLKAYEILRVGAEV
ncbi:translation elongation factor Ts [Candidatus Haliotispira prima]|uniref:Elongation factor Ts n=1 Tax=Candidatus Haliotispira prima TaxID=3034016 RepID=A0ABY8MDN1_9SPIO|nr:translation elongation factor Ts [Candidatus Haliotispira prima]